jgi:hypothetical protein
VSHCAHPEHDFNRIPDQTLIFKPTSSSPSILNVTLNITEEVLIERAESLTLNLTTTQTAVILGRKATEIRILNNDKGK